MLLCKTPSIAFFFLQNLAWLVLDCPRRQKSPFLVRFRKVRQVTFIVCINAYITRKPYLQTVSEIPQVSILLRLSQRSANNYFKTNLHLSGMKCNGKLM